MLFSRTWQGLKVWLVDMKWKTIGFGSFFLLHCIWWKSSKTGGQVKQIRLRQDEPTSLVLQPVPSIQRPSERSQRLVTDAHPDCGQPQLFAPLGPFFWRQRSTSPFYSAHQFCSFLFRRVLLLLPLLLLFLFSFLGSLTHAIAIGWRPTSDWQFGRVRDREVRRHRINLRWPPKRFHPAKVRSGASRRSGSLIIIKPMPANSGLNAVPSVFTGIIPEALQSELRSTRFSYLILKYNSVFHRSLLFSNTRRSIPMILNH